LWFLTSAGEKVLIQVATKVVKIPEELPDSTKLAVDRTHLAHERTLMAWVRTAVSLITFGFTIYKFFQYMREQNPGAPVHRLFGPREFALVMIGIGVGSLFLATLQNMHIRKTLKKSYSNIIPFSMATVIAALISLLGILAFIVVAYRQ
jgi:putative membrane protein